MNTDRKKILLVDDEPDILEFVKYNLEKEGYEVLTANSGVEAIEIAEKVIPDLIVVDVMMPGMDGVETCVRMRENKKLDDTIITFLTARNEDFTQIAGFDAGADDYITKPIKPRVLVSRIKALLRRSSGTAESVEPNKDLGGIVIDRNKYSVSKEGVEIDLPKKEFELLALLASKPGNVFTRDVILDRVWGGEVVVGDRTIDVHVRKLREKLGEDIIKTIKGVGYKFDTR
jgi:two-component system, OmpR family, alkaline phosphatase synthesis response regulator PhoP